MDDTLERIDDFLKFILLEKTNIPLIILILMSMSILNSKVAIVVGFEIEAEVEKYIFANSLIALPYKVVVREKEAIIDSFILLWDISIPFIST